MLPITVENVQKFCRTCLKNLKINNKPTTKKDEPSSYYHIDHTQNLNKWMEILKPAEANGSQQRKQYPKFVCQSCYDNFKRVHEFKEMISHSHSILYNLLESQEYKQNEEQEVIALNELLIKTEPIDNDEYEENNWDIGENVVKKANDFYTIKEIKDNFDESSPNIELAEDIIKMETTELQEPFVFNEPASPQQSQEEVGQAKATKNYKCPMCNISYVHKYTYVAHIRQMHLGIEKAFECEICHKKYTKFCNLYRHMRLDHNESLRQYKCEYENCNRSFRQLETRRKHYASYHNGQQLPNQVELISQEYFKQEHFRNSKSKKPIDALVSSCKIRKPEKKLKTTTTNYTPSRKRIFVCSICASIFETSYDLKVHMDSIHIDDLKFPCHLCGKHKISQMKLDEHIATVHHNPRVTCDICKKPLKSKSHLRQHILSVHNGVKPYACEYCPSTFAAKNTLKVHTRIHTGEKPFKCSVCDRRFRQLTPMKKHLETHERGRRNEIADKDLS